MRGLHIRAGEKKVRATMTARRCSQHASSRRKNRVVGKEEERKRKKKERKEKRSWMFLRDWSNVDPRIPGDARSSCWRAV